MTREDIFRMAREADLYEGSDDQVIRFAYLVEAAEREECAKVLDEMAAADKLSNYYQIAAVRIRERGNQ
jgi:hypothetical protein